MHIRKIHIHTLESQFIQEWHSSVENSSKCTNYRIFKTAFGFEDYLTKLPKDLRNAFVKFRTTNHRLPIETGRWRNIDRSLRFCTLCNKNCIGDEFHYLLECTYFDKLRKLYLHRKYFVTPNIIKFKDLLTSTSFETLNMLTIFIKKILNVCSS